MRIGGYAPTPELASILHALLTPGRKESYRDITPRAWIDRLGRASFDERGTAFEALCTDARLFEQVEAEVEQCLFGPPCAARFDAAMLILHQPRARARAQAFGVLIEHMADNHITDDAALAMRQLSRSPDEALPLVRAALPGRDEQQSRLLLHCMARFDPGYSKALQLKPEQLCSMGFYRGDMIADELAGH